MYNYTTVAVTVYTSLTTVRWAQFASHTITCIRHKNADKHITVKSSSLLLRKPPEHENSFREPLLAA